MAHSTMEFEDGVRVVVLVLIIYVVWRLFRGMSGWTRRCSQGKGRGLFCRLWRLLFGSHKIIG